MKKLTIATLAALVLVATLALGAIAFGALDDDNDAAPSLPAATQTVAEPSGLDAEDQPLTPREVERASEAAVELAGGGTVNDLERSDDLGEAYEVEVLSPHGEIDIALSAKFERVPNLRYDD